MRSTSLLGIVFLLCLTSFAFAQPYVSVWGSEGSASQGTSSWFGNTGMIVTPTASTPPASSATFTYHYIDRPGGSVNVAGVNFGATDWLELGGTWLDTPGGTDTYANAKITLPLERWIGNDSLPSLAIGAVDVTDQINRALYFVVSKSFPLDSLVAGTPRVTLHLGFAENELDAGPLDGIFGGIEFSALRYGTVQVEYDGVDLNADLRYNITRGLSLDVGILDGDFGVGATYRSGL